MADNNMNMQIVIESQNNTSNGFESMNSAIEAIQNLVGDLTKSFENFSNAISNAMGDATKSIEDLAQPIESATKELDSIGTASDEAAQQISEISKSLDGVANNGALNDIGKGLEDISTGASNATQSLSDISKDLDSVNEAALTSIKSLEDISKALDDVGKSSATAGSEAKENMNNMKTEAEGAAEAFGSIKTQMDLMFAGMAFNSVAQPLDNAIKNAVDSFATFDQSMRLVNEEANLNESGFKSLESSVLSLSNQTGISADELSKGLYNVMSTGLVDAAGGMKVLQAAAEGAKAGNASLDDTTKALDSVLGAYGMKADQVTNILDIMFKATNDGQMHFQDLAKSVGASATSAAMAGVSYSELAASQATLTNVGKDAQLASQQLNSLIMGIIAPTATATKEAKALGIEWDASALKAHGLSYMIDEATKATGGNDEKLKKLIPNQRAWQAVVALGTTAHGLYTKTLNDMSNASGSTAAALEQAEKGAGDAIEKMKTSIQNAGITLVSSFAPAINSVAKAIEGLTNWFNNLTPSTQKIIADVLLAITAFTTVAGVLLLVAAGVSALVGVFATGGLAATFSGIALAIGGVVAVGAVLIANWDSIASSCKTVWNSVSNTFTNAWNNIRQVFSEVWDYISPAITDGLNEIKTFWNNSWSDIKQIFSDIWSVMKVLLQPFVDAIYTIIKTALGFIQGSWKDTWNLIKDVLKTTWDLITEIIKTAWDAITGVIRAALDLIKNVFNIFKDVWTGDWSDLWTDVKNLFSDAWHDITGIFTNVATDITNIFNTLISSALNWGEDLIKGFINGIKGAMGGLISAVSDVANTVKGFLHFSVPDVGPLADADTYGPDFMDLLASGITSNISKVQKSVLSAASAMQMPITNVVNAMQAPSTGVLSSSVSNNFAYVGTNSGNGGITIGAINVTGNVAKNEKELGQTVAQEIWNQMKKQGKF